MSVAPKIILAITIISKFSFAALSPALQQSAENEALAVISAIDLIQETHRTGRGKYWQGLRTHTNIPANGTIVVADRLAQSADGAGNVSWFVKGIVLSGGRLSAYEVHEYVGPRGPGYIIIQSLVSDGEIYTRVIDRGPESRAEDWTLKVNLLQISVTPSEVKPR